MRNMLNAALLAIALVFSAGAFAQDTVNINEASAETLTTLPGIGEVKAQAIVDDRESNGEFDSLEDLTRVSGIGQGTIDNLGDSATF